MNVSKSSGCILSDLAETPNLTDINSPLLIARLTVLVEQSKIFAAELMEWSFIKAIRFLVGLGRSLFSD